MQLLKSKKAGKKILAFLLILLLLTGFLFLKAPAQKKYYPKKYPEEIALAAEKYDLDENLLYAVIHTESGFQADAVSSVGARGLTQIMPETFEWLQNKRGENYPNEALFEPAISIDYGAYFYKLLLTKYDGDIQTAAAAYHSGTGQVAKWLQEPENSKDGKTLLKIPGKNAKHYAQKILTAMEKYQEIYEKEQDT